MVLTPRGRRLALTAHVTASVGWLGAVGAVLALAVAAAGSDDPATVRALHVALDVLGRWVIVPLCLASLLTGLVQSLGTTWGLFRHYWVVAKLVINVFATVVLLLYVPSLGHLSSLARAGAGIDAFRDPSAVLHAGAALALLLLATVLSVFKPRGLTPYGWRRQRAG